MFDPCVWGRAMGFRIKQQFFRQSGAPKLRQDIGLPNIYGTTAAEGQFIPLRIAFDDAN